MCPMKQEVGRCSTPMWRHRTRFDSQQNAAKGGPSSDDPSSPLSKCRVVAIGLCAVVLLLSGCDDDESEVQPTPSPDLQLSPTDALGRVRVAVRATAGYRIVVEGHNFVLPQWGGVDDGEVNVRLDDGDVNAELERTGDDDYTMIRYDDQTFFQRSTCDYFQRVPGGGAAVLEPFVLPESILTATEVFVSAGPDVIAISGDFPNIGEALLEVDADTYLPQRLTRPRDEGGSKTVWTFADWGAAPSVDGPPGSPPDQGPGGNPC